MKTKQIGEHTDRELMEKIVLYSKKTSDATEFIKNSIVFTAVVGIFIMILGWLKVL